MSHSHEGGCCHGGGGGATLGRPVDDASLGVEYSLFRKINLDEVECLNEAEENSGRTVFKPWEQRMDKEKFVESDADEELLLNIPFSGNVKLKGLIVVGAEDGRHPAKMRLFKNRPHMTFDEARGKADQEFELVRDDRGEVEYPAKVVSFSSVSHLSIHFPSNLGNEDETRVYYIGLRGEFFEAQRTGVVNAVYEARPMMDDHKQDIKDLGMRSDNAGF